MPRITLPPILNLPRALRFRRLLSQRDPDLDYVFDFGDVGHTDPIGLLLVSDTISRFQSQQLLGSSECINHDHLGYQRTMGFFRASGFDFGLAPGQAPGGRNYLPVTHLDLNTLKLEAEERSLSVGTVIEEHAQRMSHILVRQSDGDLCDALTYALREVMRNVLEHSGFGQVHFCAQHWPTRGRVHLALLDRGKGIRASLSRNPFLEIETDLSALKLALMPGVSGRMYKGVRRNKHDIWQNTGYGLYMTSRLATSGGSFWLMSGDSALGISSHWVRELNILPFEGTALRVSFDTTRLGKLQTRLGRFEKEGRDIARQFQGADSRGASLASTMIRTRF
jgi:hypothetical protein